MNHYDYVEWLLYKNKALSDEKMNEMEDHLYDCQECMDTFLSLIDEQEEKYAEGMISSSFAPELSKKISEYKIIKLNAGRIKKKRSINYQFGYFAAVASVTIFLTLGGFYTNLVDYVPRITASMQEVQMRQNLIADFSDRIINTTSSLLLSIEDSEKDIMEEE